MPIDRVVGVQLRDEAGYLEYRRRIAPLLASYGAHFVLDVRVSEVVRAPIEGAQFDRLFILRFPDAAAWERFFADPGYAQIRAEHYEPSVSATHRLFAYDVP